jgi:hypothetical protein
MSTITNLTPLASGETTAFNVIRQSTGQGTVQAIATIN